MILTIDLGTSGPKVSLFSNNAEYLHHEFEENEVILLEQGGAEQSPLEWWDSIKRAYHKLIQNSKLDPKKIETVICTSQWSGTVACDNELKPIGNAIIWMDSRGAKHIQKIISGFPEVEGYQVFTLLKFLNKTSGAPGKSGKDPLSHILFLKEERPDVYKKTRVFLEPIDFLTLQFTGKPVASYHTIALHWLTNMKDLKNVHYDDQLISMCKIDRKKLPDLIPANSVVGTVTESIQKEFGLNADTKVIMGCSDVMSAAVGSGAVVSGLPHVYIGTSSWLVTHLPFRVIDPLHNMATLPSAIPGLYLLTNEQETAGNCINFLKKNLFYAEDTLGASKAPADFYKSLDQEAAKVKPGSDGLMFLPWLYGERSPIEDHHVRGGFFNLSLNHSRPHFARAVLEGVALNSRWLYKTVEKNAKTKFDRIHMIGGGALSDLWCQIMADVLGVKVCQMDNPIAANSQGIAFLACLALDRIKLEEIPARVKIKATYSPNAKNHELYSERFEEFKKYYDHNKKSMHSINKGL